MAAIAAVHAEAPSWQDTDWREIVALYNVLVQIWPSPVVAINRAAAVGLADGPAAGLTALDELAAEPQLAGYSYLAATRADFLRRLGRDDEARTAYEEALALTENGRARLPDDAPAPARRLTPSRSRGALRSLLGVAGPLAACRPAAVGLGHRRIVRDEEVCLA